VLVRIVSAFVCPDVRGRPGSSTQTLSTPTSRPPASIGTEMIECDPDAWRGSSNTRVAVVPFAPGGSCCRLTQVATSGSSDIWVPTIVSG
jgi:hypothetical protein